MESNNCTDLSIDSLGELSEIDNLKEKLKQKEHILGEKSEIINSLRQQVSDLNHDNEELENNQQLLHQKIDRMTKQLEEKNEELEAVSHALKEVESSHDSLRKRLEARTSQLQKFVDDLIKAKKDLEGAHAENEQLKHKNEQLMVELDLANTRKRSWQELDEEKVSQQRQQENENQRLQSIKQQTLQQQQQLQQQYRSIQQQHSLRAYEDNLLEPSQALHFQMVDEVGEFMDSSRSLLRTATKNLSEKYRSINKSLLWEQQQQYEQKQQRKQVYYDDRLTSLSDEVSVESNFHQDKQRTQQAPQQQPQPAEDVNYCQNHRLKRLQSQYQEQHQKENLIQAEEEYDPIAEYKSRVERANELARRNLKTKPLHQTSYPLELDTFDTTDLTELDIKRGTLSRQTKMPTKDQLQNLRHPPQRKPPQPPKEQRPPLANFSNTPPKRIVYKKAEAFIV